MKYKKLTLSIGALATIVAPVAVVVSCSSSKVVKTHKTDYESIKIYNQQAAQWEKDFPMVKGKYEKGYLKPGAFALEKLPKNFYLPEFITGVGDGAFYNATLNDDFKLKGDVRSIGVDAFNGVILPKDFKLPRTVFNISDSAFANAIFKGDIAFDNNLITMGPSAFEQATFEGAFGFAPLMDKIPTSAFSGVVFKNLQKVKFDLSNVIEIGDSAFKFAKLPQDFKISERTQFIAGRAFSGSTFLEKFVIPKSVTSIGDEVFAQAIFKNGIDIKPEFKEIPQSAFEGVEFKEAIHWKASIIGNSAFKNAIIPAGTTFDNITKLNSFSFGGANLPENFVLPNTFEYEDVSSGGGRFGGGSAAIVSGPFEGTTLKIGFTLPSFEDFIRKTVAELKLQNPNDADESLKNRAIDKAKDRINKLLTGTRLDEPQNGIHLSWDKIDSGRNIPLPGAKVV